MLYSEFLEGTQAPANANTYSQYLEIESIYMNKELMTKQQAYSLWKRRYKEKSITIPRSKELKEIKEAIKTFKDSRSDAKYQENKIIKDYNERIAEYNPNEWYDSMVINRLEQYKNKQINDLYDSFGNDAMIQIIYTDGSHLIVSGIEIVAGEVTPKLQNIAYASYQDGWVSFDTLTGDLTDIWNLELDEDLEAREQYFTNIEILFNTEWGTKNKDKYQPLNNISSMIN